MMFKQYLKIGDSKSGKGVFTTMQIPADAPIAEANGPVYAEAEVPNLQDPAILQIGPNTFMGASGHLLPEYINHSCDPNCAFHIVGNRAILYSLYVIPAGTELTFDYSTTSTDTHQTWKMTCSCDTHKCRGTISGHQYLSSALQEDYKNKGALPLFITFPIFQKR
jgi:SET domain